MFFDESIDFVCYGLVHIFQLSKYITQVNEQ